MSNRSVTIIGAGPAGAACAIRLAESGVRVTITERAAFPRVKVCGEFVSPAAAHILESLVPTADLVALGAERIDRFTLSGPGDRVRTRRLPRKGWALSRAGLDQALSRVAADKGVALRQPASVRDVRHDDEHTHVTLSPSETLRSDVVIHADGSGRFDAGPKRGNAPGVVGLKCHYRSASPTPGVVIRPCRQGYVGLIDVERGLSTCALVASQALVRRCRGDADEIVRTLWNDDGCPIHPDNRVGDWLSSGVPRSAFRRAGSPRSFRIGNAAAAVDPVGGEGIGLALWSGDRLGRRLGELDHWSIEHLRRQQLDHERAYRRRLRLRRPGCRAAAWIVSRPNMVRALTPLLALGDAAWWPWFAMTGKPLRAG
ncbi:MAG: FAD-dependent monooxygenase [Planctomycetota bacterium]